MGWTAQDVLIFDGEVRVTTDFGNAENTPVKALFDRLVDTTPKCHRLLMVYWYGLECAVGWIGFCKNPVDINVAQELTHGIYFSNCKYSGHHQLHQRQFAVQQEGQYFFFYDIDFPYCPKFKEKVRMSFENLSLT